jgi:hypothetical protein
MALAPWDPICEPIQPIQSNSYERIKFLPSITYDVLKFIVTGDRYISAEDGIKKGNTPNLNVVAYIKFARPIMRSSGTDQLLASFGVGTPLSDIPSLPFMSSTDSKVFLNAHFYTR